MKRTTAAFVTLSLAILAYVIVVCLTDKVFWRGTIPPGREQRAAVAIRDDVTPFQKWGSKTFTIPYLKRYYNESWYFTQSSIHDQKEEFLSSLGYALDRYSVVDLYLLAHGNHFIEWVGELDETQRAHLRLVYNTGCRDLSQGPQWLNLGAKAYVGHPGVSASPVFYFYFLRRWTRGHVLRASVDDANHSMEFALVRMNLVTGGQGDPSQVYAESKAMCFGDDRLLLGGSEP